jgi:hypothetical protein
VTEALDRGEDLVGLGPFEGSGILVVVIDEGADVSFQLLDGGVNTALEPLSGKLAASLLCSAAPRWRFSCFRRRSWSLIAAPISACLSASVIAVLL